MVVWQLDPSKIMVELCNSEHIGNRCPPYSRISRNLINHPLQNYLVSHNALEAGACCIACV